VGKESATGLGRESSLAQWQPRFEQTEESRKLVRQILEETARSARTRQVRRALDNALRALKEPQPKPSP
jgi:hypothetical protein